MCADLGLVMEEMPTPESDATKGLVSLLDGLVYRGIICPDINDDLKMPFIALYT